MPQGPHLLFLSAAFGSTKRLEKVFVASRESGIDQHPAVPGSSDTFSHGDDNGNDNGINTDAGKVRRAGE
jgi:hypothetical protein